MSTRAESLATKVEQANSALEAAVQGTNDAQWKAKCADGEWSQGFSGFHAAGSPAEQAAGLEFLLDGLHLNKRLNKDKMGAKTQYRG